MSLDDDLRSASTSGDGMALYELSCHYDTDVRLNVAWNTATPPDVLTMLVCDPEISVSDVALSNLSRNHNEWLWFKASDLPGFQEWKVWCSEKRAAILLTIHWCPKEPFEVENAAELPMDWLVQLKRRYPREAPVG